jgi:hypothetical protein
MSGAIHPFRQVRSAVIQTALSFLLVVSQTERLSTFTKNRKCDLLPPVISAAVSIACSCFSFDMLRQKFDLLRQFKYSTLKFRESLVQTVKILTIFSGQEIQNYLNS